MHDAESPRLDRLRSYLASIPAGPITELGELPNLLATCWGDLHGGDFEAMAGHKLHNRMEDVTWDPPVLSFTIERHGGTVLGSSRATLQRRDVDVVEGSASCMEVGHRQLRPMQPRLDVAPLVEEIAGLIVAEQEDRRLTWDAEGQVRVLIRYILPSGSAVKQTLAVRRKRFRTALEERLCEAGWEECGLYQYRQGKPSAKEGQ
jgi:hypothetical protein